MQFCPCDGTLLQVTVAAGNELRFFCPVCPYIHCPTTKTVTEVPTARKRLDDIHGGKAALENQEKTEVVCPECGNGEAFFKQVQMRSADEPMTIFYTCTRCQHRWREQ